MRLRTLSYDAFDRKSKLIRKYGMRFMVMINLEMLSVTIFFLTLMEIVTEQRTKNIFYFLIELLPLY